MAEDCICTGGFGFFAVDGQGPYIADAKAVEKALALLVNEIAFEAALPHLGSATEAVQSAARMKAVQDADAPNLADVMDFSEASDFLL